MTPDEEWRPAVGYDGAYEVSSQGRVRSLPRDILRPDGIVQPRRGKVLAAHFNRGGYPMVTLCGGQRPRQSFCLHTLVAYAFLGPRPDDMDICHWNDVKTDNRVENLRYASRTDNLRDAVRNEINPNSKKTHCKYGHEFTPANTRQSRRQRVCRTCVRQRARLSYVPRGVAQ